MTAQSILLIFIVLNAIFFVRAIYKDNSVLMALNGTAMLVCLYVLLAS